MVLREHVGAGVWRDTVVGARFYDAVICAPLVRYEGAVQYDGRGS